MQLSEKQNFRAQVKHSPAWWAKAIRGLVYGWRYGQIPSLAYVHRPLWWLHHTVLGASRQLAQQLYFTPLFKSRLKNAPRAMQLYSGMPQVGGPLELEFGERCRVSGISSFFGRSAGHEKVICQIGSNVDVGWQCTFAVGRRIVIEDDVRIAGRCYLAGFPGHPECPTKRALGEPELDDQVGDIVLKNNVWLASGVTVLAGVTIGENSIIGAGSVVTKDIPANVVAAGVPAQVIRPIHASQDGGA